MSTFEPLWPVVKPLIARAQPGGKLPRRNGNGWIGAIHSPLRQDRHPSFSVHPDSETDPGAWVDHARDERGSVADLARRLGVHPKANRVSVEIPTNVRRSKSRGKSTAQERILETYTYQNPDGLTLFEVVRYEPKAFRHRRPDGAGGWIWNLGDVRRVLYRLPQVIASDPRAVFICEGEKDVHSLERLGVIATTTPGGASATRKCDLRPLMGRVCVIVPDADEAGEKHARALKNMLKGVASEVLVLRLPGLASGGDVSDWIEQGHDLANLVRLVRKERQYV